MQRFRRLRKNETIRSMMRETRLHPADFIYPIFVIEGENIKNPVASMPGVFQYSIDRLGEIMEEVKASGISGVLLFGIPACKDEMGSQAYARDGITQRAVAYIKKNYPDIYCIVDVCLCEYTSHGHCGVVKDGKILNDETLPLLSAMSVTLAEAGADMIAPSDMMDGRVAAIREALDENGFTDIPIWPTALNSHPLIMGHSGMPPIPLPGLGTGKAIRWILPMGRRRCVRFIPISRKARTWLW